MQSKTFERGPTNFSITQKFPAIYHYSRLLRPVSVSLVGESRPEEVALSDEVYRGSISQNRHANGHGCLGLIDNAYGLQIYELPLKLK